MAKSKHCIILVTAPDSRIARKIARSALAARLIACANLVSGIESIYQWKGKIEQGKEVLLLLKTARSKVAELEEHVIKNHPYDTPEFVVLDIAQGNKRYLQWLTESCAA